MNSFRPAADGYFFAGRHAAPWMTLAGAAIAAALTLCVFVAGVTDPGGPNRTSAPSALFLGP